MLASEPGIGKTRMAEEFVDRARGQGAIRLWGRCYEGDWAPPYGPFTEVIREYAADADVEELRTDLGVGAAPIARLVPSLREQLPNIPEPEALQADEERFRLLDAVSQFLIAASARAPMVVVIEDLHWADRGTVDLLRHVSRFAPQHPLLVVGTYRDAEIDSEHPLSDILEALH